MHLSRIVMRGFRASAEREFECRLPGRFSVLVGANSAGKSTVSESILLSHPRTFPASGGRMSAAMLGHGARGIDVEYRFEPDYATEGPLGRQLALAAGTFTPSGTVASWKRELARNLGGVRTVNVTDSYPPDGIRMIYLPAWRNPLDELARREATILVELMRAQQQRIDGTRNLSTLRARAGALLEALTSDGIIKQVEERIAAHLRSLSAGVGTQWPYVRGQAVDDAYLGRVLELMLATLEGRAHARPLDVTGLGYVNLLHIAVTLAAIPDPSVPPSAAPTTSPPVLIDPAAGGLPVGDDVQQARAVMEQARIEAEAEEDSFFPSDAFHAVVVIEEPEAHLHPQLQFALVRYLRQVVRDRPEIQIVISSHANDIISACEPDELVVLRRRGEDRVSIPLVELPVTAEVKRKARLHMDATRSSALFAERLLLVEGVTEVALVRQLGRLWAAGNPDKRAFVDALTVVAMGTKVGPWAPALLASRGQELCTRLAVLRDSDVDFDDPIPAPTWSANHDPDVLQVFHSHPTLEPALTAGNEGIVAAVLTRMGLIEAGAALTPQSVHTMFSGRKSAKNGEPAIPAGPGNSRKAEFALELADELEATQPYSGDAFDFLAEHGYSPPVVPAHIAAVLDFLYPAPPTPGPVDLAGPATTEEPGSGDGGD